MVRKNVRAVIRNGEKLFLIRNEGRDYWTLPGGEIESGERLKEALKRELKEELGWEIEVGKRLGEWKWERDEVKNEEVWFEVGVGEMKEEGGEERVKEAGWKKEGEVKVKPENLWEEMKKL